MENVGLRSRMFLLPSPPDTRSMCLQCHASPVDPCRDSDKYRYPKGLTPESDAQENVHVFLLVSFVSCFVCTHDSQLDVCCQEITGNARVMCISGFTTKTPFPVRFLSMEVAPVMRTVLVPNSNVGMHVWEENVSKAPRSQRI